MGTGGFHDFFVEYVFNLPGFQTNAIKMDNYHLKK